MDYITPMSKLSTTEERRIADDETSVHIRKVRTPNGARLEIVDPASGRSTQLDPLELEGVTWQEDQFFTDILDTGPRAAVQVSRDDFTQEGVFTIQNEYTLVEMVVADIRERDCLLVRSSKTGYATHLSASDLAVLAKREKIFFSNLLQNPLGPEDEED